MCLLLCISTNEQIGNDGMFCVLASLQKIGKMCFGVYVCMSEREREKKERKMGLWFGGISHFILFCFCLVVQKLHVDVLSLLDKEKTVRDLFRRERNLILNPNIENVDFMGSL